MLSHRARMMSARNIISSCGMRSDDVVMPLNGAERVGFNRHLFAAVMLGIPVVLYGGTIFLADFFRAAHKYKPTFLLMTPSALALFLNCPDELKKCVDIFRVLRIGAAPTPVKHMEAIKALLQKSDLYIVCEPTECGCSMHYKFSEYPIQSRCIGTPGEFTQVFIVDGNGKVMENSSETNQGLIAYGGEANMDGYWNEPELTRSVLRDGLLITADVGYIKDGNVYLTSRKDDIINTGGYNVAPYEIEDIVMLMPGVIECACVPVVNNILGVMPVLYVVMDAGAEFNAKAIQSALASHLESYKLPRTIRQLDELPKIGEARKVDRKQLSEFA